MKRFCSTLACIGNSILRGTGPMWKRLYRGPDLQFDAYCVFCEKDATFKQYVHARGGGAGMSTPKGRDLPRGPYHPP